MSPRTLLPLTALLLAGSAGAQGEAPEDAAHSHVHAVAPEAILALPDALRQEFGALIMQDFQGRMKPMDTAAHEIVRKVTKRARYEDWDPLDLYLSWITVPDHWWQKPLIFIRHPGLKDLVGVGPEVTHVAPAHLFEEGGAYRLLGDVDAAFRTPDRDRSKLQRKLIAFDERLNLLYLSLHGRTLRVFPIPGDPNHAWDSLDKVQGRLEDSANTRYGEAHLDLRTGLHDRDVARLQRGIAGIRAIQAEFGADVLPSPAARESELFLNRTGLLERALWPYFFAFVLLLPAYFLSLLRKSGPVRAWTRGLFGLGMILYGVAFVAHLIAYVLRWIASGRAPLSNGFESLLFISLAVGLAGFIFEWKDRRGAVAAMSALLAFVVLGISMASHFDPAIGLLAPVLDSNWLIIHVTVITASYGFLGLAGAIGALMMGLYLMKAPGRTDVRRAIFKLDRLLSSVTAWGIALLTVGTLLGGVWANESWGRYWGWDPKETWSLITILVYATVQHCRWVPRLNDPWVLAAGCFAGIASIVMTYFGVNYFLSGLHSYAQGEAIQVPTWVYTGSALMLALIASSYLVDRRRRW